MIIAKIQGGGKNILGFDGLPDQIIQISPDCAKISQRFILIMEHSC